MKNGTLNIPDFAELIRIKNTLYLDFINQIISGLLL